jgi:transposase InsO family protein
LVDQPVLMASEVIPMDVKIRVAVADPLLNVRAWCRQYGVGKSTFYKWKARYLAGGLDGLADRPRRPLRSPGQTSVEIEDEIVRLRKDLGDAGLDAGADTIRWHLTQSGRSTPSTATVWRILARRGLVTPQPRKRPRSSWKSFERARPNDCWQIDATKWTLATGRQVEIIDIIDDHSRVIVGALVVATTNAELAWTTICHAAEHWGLPAEVLSDNGTPFTSLLFTNNLAHCNVATINSRPYHPQTCGKIERFHQTLKLRLNHQPTARSIPQLQRQIDQFIEIYNHHRPHRGIGRTTPITRWNASPAAQPAGPRITRAIPKISHHPITSIGLLELDPWRINIGQRHAGDHVTVYQHDLNVLVFNHTGELIHTRTINPDKPYQPSQRVRDDPRHPRPR